MALFNESNDKESSMVKRGLMWTVGLFNVLLAVVVIFFIVNTGKLWEGDELQKPRLDVVGEGKVFVRPDIAQFSASIVSSAVRVGDAQSQNSTKNNAVIAFLKKNGVQEKDIKTVNYSVQPQYQYDNRPCPSGPAYIPCPPTHPPRIVSYQVRSSIQIKVRDLNNVDDLLEGVVSAGANEVSSLTFTLDDEKSAMAEARKKAIEDAQQKALVLASDLGVRIKKIVAFSESGGGVPPIYFSRGAMEVAMESKAAPEVQPGEQEIQSIVTITYEFR